MSPHCQESLEEKVGWAIVLARGRIAPHTTKKWNSGAPDIGRVTRSRRMERSPYSYAATVTLQRHFKSMRFEHKDLWARKRPLSSVAYDRKPVCCTGALSTMRTNQHGV